LQLNEKRIRDRHVLGKKLDADADKKRMHDEEGRPIHLPKSAPATS
jgi:hypothetical protein